MNEYEIDAAVQRYPADTILGQAARFLSEFRREVNRHSDGWAYWRLPFKAAERLMSLVQAKQPLSEKELNKAIIPIKAFYTRHGYAAGMKLPQIPDLSPKPAREKASAAARQSPLFQAARYLNEQTLQIILALHALKKFAIYDTCVHPARSDWITRVREYWKQLPDNAMQAAGLNKNVLDFERVLSFEVTDEMMNTTAEDMDERFVFSTDPI